MKLFQQKEEDMMDLDQLKSITMLSYLEDHMLEKILKISNIKTYRSGDFIFYEEEKASNIYSVIDGKVGLEIEKNSSTRILINDITTGMTFGFSALVNTQDKNYTTSAKALSDTTLFMLKAEEIESLFSKDYEMGFLFMKRIAKIIKTRLQIRNVQFIDIYK